MLLSQAKQDFLKSHASNDERENLAIWRVIQREGLGLLMEPTTLVLTAIQVQKLKQIFAQLKQGLPIQYAIGHTWFYDCKILVEPGVLIPRPETEELVHWALADIKKLNHMGLHVLDAGTGSGCIALALKKHQPNLKVWACDAHEVPIELTSKNAALNEIELEDIVQLNLLDPQCLKAVPEFDVILCNPPYVLESDQDGMAEHVLRFEPHEALFVSNSNPLLFYEALVAAVKWRNSRPCVMYFEIHEKMAERLIAKLDELNLTEIELRVDMQLTLLESP